MRLTYQADDGADLRAQPDRHARARRLPLRGVALAGRLRGRAAGRRRLAGRRGADAGQRLPGGQQQPHDRPGHQQDRSAGRRSRERPPPDRGGDRHRRLGGDPGVGQGREGDPRDPRGGRRQGAAARRRRRRAAARAAARQLVRQPTAASSSWCASSTACCGPKQKVRFMAARRDYEIQTIGAFAPFAREVARARRRARSASSPPPSRRSPTRASATPSPRPSARAPSRCPASSRSSRWCSPGIFPTDSARYDGSARRARQAAPQRRVVHARARDLGGARLRLSLRLPRPAAHGDRPGAARARVRPRPHHDRADGALPLRAARRRASSSSTTRPSSRPRARSTGSRSRSSPSPSTRRPSTSAASSSCARRSAARRPA